MSRIYGRLLAAAVTLCWVGAGSRADEAEKANAQAREVVEKLAKAVKAKDIDAVMKIVDVPFFWDGKKTIKDRDDLRKEIVGVFAEKDFSEVTLEVKEVFTVEVVQGKLKEKERELLKDVVTKDDRVVLLGTNMDKDKVAVFVRLRDGKARVVGIRD